MVSPSLDTGSMRCSSQAALDWLDSLSTLHCEDGAFGSGTEVLHAGLHGLWDVDSSADSSQSVTDSRTPSHGRESTRAPTETSSAEEDDRENDSESQSSASGRSQKKKTKIALDPAQPPTLEGNPRARVFVACHDCRSRKIRCDGARPVCFNCRRRAPETEVCDYDPAPKRRGQDKAPGARTRSAVGTRRPRRLTQRQSALQEGSASSGGAIQLQWRYENMPDYRPQDSIDNFDPSSFNVGDVEAYQIPAPPVDELEENADEDAEPITPEPSVQFTRDTWWDSLLMFYASEDAGDALRSIPLTAERRTSLTQRVLIDIRSLFRTSIYWGSFLHIPRFFDTLLDPVRRMTLQPSLIMSMLAVGTFVQSSELRLGVRGRKRAMKLIDQAHSALQASLSSNWTDVGLIQAAWLLAFFEMQAHPDQSTVRSRSAFLLLDSLIRLFSLTTLDVDVPSSRFSLFAVQNSAQPAPTAQDPGLAQYDCANNFFALIPPLEAAPPESHHAHEQVPAAAGCSCEQYTLKQQWPAVLEVAPLWQATAMWPTALTEGEIRKEECRRLVWSSVTLAAGHNSYTSAGSTGFERTDLFIKHYDNYALLLPGEALAQAGTPVGHNNVWALFVRAMLLWHTGIRIQSDRFIHDFQRAQFAIDAWMEAEAIEDALNQHTCGLEQRLAYQAREFLFNAKMSVSLDFQRFLPHIPADGSSLRYREMIEVFLRRQMAVVQSLWDCMHTNPANELGTRSFIVYWFMGHVTRALVLWENDPTLILALDAAKLFVQPLEYLMQLWPCPSQRDKWQSMRYKLVDSCLKAGIPSPCRSLPPPPPKTGLCAPLVPLESFQLPPL
ncbi:hypothetical protein C8Q78DRAFT_1033916 [Trametes maxima]|nr:hypothetical protein C8Q78DRAFT_1033916 [Trametes maxima]